MSRKSFGIAFAAALAFGGLALSSAPAAATPLLDPGLSRAAQTDRAKPEQARIVCNRWGGAAGIAPIAGARASTVGGITAGAAAITAGAIAITAGAITVAEARTALPAIRGRRARSRASARRRGRGAP